MLIVTLVLMVIICLVVGLMELCEKFLERYLGIDDLNDYLNQN